MTTATTTIAIRQLTPVFGAEIKGVDLRDLDDAAFAKIEEAFETYSVLVFPERRLDDDAQIAFSRRFGDLEKTQGHIANNFQVRHVSVISNLDKGNALLKELLEFATREKFTYMHRWRLGDLVMYDNRAVLHRARPYAITTHPRVLHRTTVAGEGPTAE